MRDPADAKTSSLREAQNVILRPTGMLSRPFAYKRFGIGSREGDPPAPYPMETVFDYTLEQMPMEESVGAFYFYEERHEERGGLVAFLNRDTKKILGFYATGALDGGEVFSEDARLACRFLRGGFDPDAQWNMERVGSAYYCGNGIDENLLLTFNGHTPRLEPLSMPDSLRPQQPQIELIYHPVAYPPSAQVYVPTYNVDELNTPYWAKSPPPQNSVQFFAAAGFAGEQNNGTHRVRLVVSINNSSTSDTGNTFTSTFANNLYTVTVNVRQYSGYVVAGGGVVSVTRVGVRIGDLVKYINTDPKIQGTISARISGPANAAFSGNLDRTVTLNGGVGDALDPKGFTNTRLSVKITYSQGGQLEDSGIESAPSPPRTVEFFGKSSDFRIRLIPTGGIPQPYTHIKVYVQLNTGLAREEPYKLIGFFPSFIDEIISPVKLVQKLSDYGDEYLDDKYYIEPCRYFSHCAGRWFFAGNAKRPTRVWLTAPRRADVPARACYLKEFLTVPGKDNFAAGNQIRAVFVSYARLHYHIGNNIIVVDPATFKTYVSNVVACAMNTRCIASTDNGQIHFLGADGFLYRFSRELLKVTETTMVARDSLTAIREAIGNRSLGVCGEMANSRVDLINQLIWFFVPKVVDNGETRNIIFAYDLEQQGLFGALDAPDIQWNVRLGVTDSRMVFLDGAGRLMVADLAAIAHTANRFEPSEPFTYLENTPVENGIPPLLTSRGWLRRGRRMVMETAFLSFSGSSNYRQQVFAVRFSTKVNSRGYVRVTVESDNGASSTREYGEVYGRDRHKAGFLISGWSFRVRFEIETGEDSPFSLTDVAVDYAIQGHL